MPGRDSEPHDSWPLLQALLDSGGVCSMDTYLAYDIYGWYVFGSRFVVHTASTWLGL